jgi:hypothetical protein
MKAIPRCLFRCSRRPQACSNDFGICVKLSGEETFLHPSFLRSPIGSHPQPTFGSTPQPVTQSQKVDAEAVKNDAKRRLDTAERRLDTAEADKNAAERRRDEAELHVSNLMRDGAPAGMIAEARAVLTRRDADLDHARAARNEAFALYASLVPRPVVPLAPLSMDDVNAWLNANPLTIAQPTPPTSALWWRLGGEPLNANSAAWSARSGLNLLIGVSGAGKTRSLYEMLAHKFGFYWTCSRAGNGGQCRAAAVGAVAVGESRRRAP